MNMYEILLGRLPDGLKVTDCKEGRLKFKITFDYDGTSAKAELPKSCTPGNHEAVADYCIRTAMSSIMFELGNLAAAKEWLTKTSETSLAREDGNIPNTPQKYRITFLEVYVKQLNALSDELLDLQDKYEVTADLKSVERLSGTLTTLKEIVDNLPLA